MFLEAHLEEFSDQDRRKLRAADLELLRRLKAESHRHTFHVGRCRPASTLRVYNQRSEFRRKIFARDRSQCALCPYRGPEWEGDHIVPVAFGGTDDLSNLRTLCIPCHKSETNRVIYRKG